MIHEIDTAWNGELKFTAAIDGVMIHMDAAGSGVKPKKLMLAALAGCTGMDVISILKKMKVEPVRFNVRTIGNVTEEHPKRYDRMHLVYEFEGENLPLEKLRKAIELSQERYCGVSHVYREAMPLTYEISVKERVTRE